ncbi:MAG TPA: SEC-C metal-binding domain-containing protein [Anaerolineae bacterium]|nr:SEC-C metal-binding domain-containing protein [Anaerolineae bacterium]HQK15308.1 SEC-C metal-binding domain-containing protein [Anaerolineae bacterium]
MIIRNVGRNDPCPCGSGKKYKHCHGRPKPPAEVLYIHPAKQDVDFYAEMQAQRETQMGRPYGLIPLGVPALVNSLRAAGIEVRGVNFPLERELDRAFDLRHWLRQQTRARVILIDLHWYEHSYGALSVAKVCKEVLPHAWIILGGLTASGFAREILERFPTVDFVVRGDAEQPLLTLVRRCLAATEAAVPLFADVPNLSYRRDGAVVENPIGYCATTADLDRLDYVDLSFMEHYVEYFVHEYLVTDLARARAALKTNPYLGRWIATARGCKYECSYCGGCKSAHQTLAARDGLVPRSPEAVVNELERLATSGVIQASLSYDIAELGDEYWRTMFSLMRQRQIKIGLYNECFQLPSPNFVKRFAQVADLEHSCLAFSPLSGSERVRRLNGKIFTNGELINILDALNQYGVFALIYFSLNLPGETPETLRESIALAQEICRLYPPSRIRILNSCHTLDPLSPMAVLPEKYAIHVTMRTFDDWYTYCYETQLGGAASRTEMYRGFVLQDSTARTLEAMADAWDAARQGHEESWWPIPPGW